jgi:hypothetical protein
MTKTRREFTPEFKWEAVALLESSDRPLMQPFWLLSGGNATYLTVQIFRAGPPLIHIVSSGRARSLYLPSVRGNHSPWS